MRALGGAASTDELASHIQPATGATSAEALSIYRRSMQTTWVNTLRLSFPTVVRRVGDEFFDTVANSFAQDTPSRHGDLDCYGAGFNEHLGKLPASIDLPWLADLARFEWLLHELHRRAPRPVLTRGELAEMDIAALADRKLPLASRATLFESRWPVVRIWQAHGEHADDPDLDAVDPRPDRVLVCAADGTRIISLSEGSWIFFSTLAAGDPLLEAVDRALAVDPDFDFQSTFGAALDSGALAALRP